MTMFSSQTPFIIRIKKMCWKIADIFQPDSIRQLMKKILVFGQSKGSCSKSNRKDM